MSKYCQSCAIPFREDILGTKDMYGTETNGSLSSMYCSRCYQDGQFTQDISIKELASSRAQEMADHNPPLTREEANNMLQHVLSQLKRWKKKSTIG